MSTGEQVLRRLRAAAQSVRDKTGKPAATEELLIRHALESFLDRLVRTPHGPASALRLVDALRATGHPVAGVEVRRPSLDDVFLALTGRSLRD